MKRFVVALAAAGLALASCGPTVTDLGSGDATHADTNDLRTGAARDSPSRSATASARRAPPTALPTQYGTSSRVAADAAAAD